MQQLFCLLFSFCSLLYPIFQDLSGRTAIPENNSEKISDAYSEKAQFIATADLLDAAINSLNSLNSLIKKEAYRNKIASFNNPASAEIGFNLEGEIQRAVRPLLDKTRNTNRNKFSAVMSSLINNPVREQFSNGGFAPLTIFSTVLGLVGNLTLSEKRITRQDLDSFMLNTSKYFVQYDKLNKANIVFDQNINKFIVRLQDLQFDIREFMQDLVALIYKDTTRQQFKKYNLEELMLKYLDKSRLENKFSSVDLQVKYPNDGIKTAKEIVYGIQKMFLQYQEIFAANYIEIKAILFQSKDLIKNADVKQVDASIQQLEALYNDSKDADILNLRINTLLERLRSLVSKEQPG